MHSTSTRTQFNPVTMADLSHYVQYSEGKGFDQSDCVLLDMKHNLLTRTFKEIKFGLGMTVADMKEKVYKHTGSMPSAQSLALDGKGLFDDSRELRSYYPKNHGLLTVTDTDPFSIARGGALEDVSLVKKYEMSDEDYNRRENTVRNFIKKKKAEDPNWRAPVFRPTNALPPDYRNLEQIQHAFKIGDRVECFPGARRGVIKWIGYAPEDTKEQKEAKAAAKAAEEKQKELERPTISVNYAKPETKEQPEETTTTTTPAPETATPTPSAEAKAVSDVIESTEKLSLSAKIVESQEVKLDEFGQVIEEEPEDFEPVWIGVQFDAPYGRNNGVFKGTRFFTCDKNCGSFMLPAAIKVGDFPEEDPFATSSDEDDDVDVEL